MNPRTMPIGPVPRERALARVAAAAWRSRPGRSTARNTSAVVRSSARSRASSPTRDLTRSSEFAVGDTPAPRARSRIAVTIDAARRSRTTRFASTPSASHARTSSSPAPPAPPPSRAEARTTRAVDPSTSRARSRRSRSASSAASRSRLLITTTWRARRGSQRRRKSSWSTASWYFSGSVTQATASTRGRSSSTRSRCDRSTESMSGRSRTATFARPGAPCSFTCVTLSHRSRPSTSRRAVAGTHATGSEVVGRRTDAALTDAPARALSRLDLPTPVPPTSATT
jgi:hypothetical protein